MQVLNSLNMRFAGAVLVCYGSAMAVAAAAEDWHIVRHEGRDYLTLENIAAFYGFPAPPALPTVQSTDPAAVTTPPPGTSVPTPAKAPPAPTPPAAPAQATGLAPIAEGPPGTPIPAVPTGPLLPKTIALDSGRWRLEVSPNSQEVMINGVKQWLTYPTVVQGSKLLISRLDVSKVIEPRLRPEMIQGFQPVNTIVLDPGHGGHDKGAISRYGFEKDFALDVGLRARKLLEARGYKVAMTRTTDVFIPLHQRAELAKALPESIFVSVHFNASNANHDARGFEIFSMAPRGAPATNDAVFSMRDLREEPGNAHELQSSALAASIYHSLLGQVPMIDRGLKHARFAVLRLATVPAVLIECGFVSNGAESALIGSPAWRARVAEAIVEGVGEYKSLAELKQRPKVIAEYRQADSGTGVAPSSAAPETRPPSAK